MTITPEQPIPDVLDAAARLIEGNGLHGETLWPGADADRTKYNGSSALDVFAAIGVASGITDADTIYADIAYGCDHGDHGPAPAVLALVAHLDLDGAMALTEWSDEHAERGLAGVVVETLRACAAQLRAAVTA